jgi:hypothetical protein
MDTNTMGHPNKNEDGHRSKNRMIDEVLTKVITPLTNRAVVNDISNAKITVLC